MKVLFKLMTIGLLAISMLALFVACREDGRFVFRNDSDHETRIMIDRASSTISPNSTYERNWSLSYSIFGIDERSFDLTIRRRILIWEDVTERIRVRAGSTTREKVSDYYDAAGLEVINDSNAFSITQVYISPTTDTHWGENKLSDRIRPGSSRLWNLSDGKWDILVVDNWGDEFAMFDNDFRIGQLRHYRYTGFRRVNNASELKQMKASQETAGSKRIEEIRE